MHKPNTHQVGTASELRVAFELIGRGYNVYFSFTGTGTADLIVEHKNELYKIQVKTAREGEKTATIGMGRSYAVEEVDVFAFYLPRLDKVYFFEYGEVRASETYRFELPSAFFAYSIRKEMEQLYETFPLRNEDEE